MSRLLSLYPAAWRDRYGAELEDLLAQRPPTVRDQVDLIRGALDARLHPQVLAASGGDRPHASPSTIGGAIGAVLGGALWIAAGLVLNAAAFNPATGYRESSTAIAILVGGALASGLAAVLLAASSSRGRTAGGSMIVLTILIVLPWPLPLVGILGYAAATIAYGVVLIREFGQPLGIPLAITGFLITSMNLQDERAVLTVPLGVVWLAVGSLAILRPAPAPTRT